MVLRHPLTRFLSQLRDDLTRVVFTVAVYAALLAVGIASFLALPTPELRVVVLGVLVVLSSLTTRVSLSNSQAIAGNDALERKLKELEESFRGVTMEGERKDKEIARLRTDLQCAEVRTSGKLKFLLELNIAEIDATHRRTIDYLIHKKVVEGRPRIEAWTTLDPDFDAKNGDARVIGAYRYPYKAKLGIDLREVRGAISENGKALRYALPPPKVTGVLNGVEEPSWEYRVALHNAELPSDIRLSWDTKNPLCRNPLYRKDRWVWEDESNSPKEYSIWSEVKDEVHRSVQAGGSLQPELKQIADQLAEQLFEGMVRSFWGLEPVRVPVEEIASPRVFAELIEEHSQVRNLYQEGLQY